MSETSGNYKELLGALCMGAADYDASEIHRAVKVTMMIGEGVGML